MFDALWLSSKVEPNMLPKPIRYIYIIIYIYINKIVYIVLIYYYIYIPLCIPIFGYICNVGYRLVWGYTIVSTDLKIIV